MYRKMTICAAAMMVAMAFTADGAAARGFGGGHGGGGFHGGGGGFHAGGGGAFRGGAMGGGNAFRGAAVNGGAFRGAAVNPAARFGGPLGSTRFAGRNPNWSGGNWRHGRGGRGFGVGLALGLAGSSYYNSYASYPYGDGYYGYGYYDDQYYAGDDGYYAVPDETASCYVARRVHTRHGWRMRRIFVCG